MQKQKIKKFIFKTDKSIIYSRNIAGTHFTCKIIVIEIRLKRTWQANTHDCDGCGEILGNLFLLARLLSIAMKKKNNNNNNNKIKPYHSPWKQMELINCSSFSKPHTASQGDHEMHVKLLWVLSLCLEMMLACCLMFLLETKNKQTNQGCP